MSRGRYLWLWTLIAVTIIVVAAVAITRPSGSDDRATADVGTTGSVGADDTSTADAPPTVRSELTTPAWLADQMQEESAQFQSRLSGAAATTTTDGPPVVAPDGGEAATTPPAVPGTDVSTASTGPVTGSSPSAQRSSSSAATTPSMPPTGLPGELDEAPSVPRLTATPSDFATPEQVAAAHFAAWCYQPLDQPVNQNIATAKQWVTAVGYDSDKAGALNEKEWREQVDSDLTPICGPVSAVISPDASVEGNVRWVLVQAQRAYVDGDGTIVGQQQIGGTFRVLQHTDGRWLVDMKVQAG